jgi:hypothetical protein
MKLKIALVLLMALTPALAQAKPKSGSSHMRPQLFHDRTPKARTLNSHVHEIRLPTPKSPPPLPVKEDFEL